MGVPVLVVVTVVKQSQLLVLRLSLEFDNKMTTNLMNVMSVPVSNKVPNNEAPVQCEQFKTQTKVFNISNCC